MDESTRGRARSPGGSCRRRRGRGTPRSRAGRLRDVANARLHAETKERPVDRFAREQPLLLPRAPRWSADLTGIAVQQHDLSIYDAIGDPSLRALTLSERAKS